jgi:putative membrane protein
MQPCCIHIQASIRMRILDAVSAFFNLITLMKNKLISCFGVLAICLGVAASAAKKPTESELSARDKKFMANAAKGGEMEFNWGKLAAQNGQSEDVKKFGNRMVTDHSKANSELMALAKEEGVKLPAAKEPGKWKSDKDYMDAMVKDHEKDLAEFQDEAKNGTDPDVKQFAEKTSKIVSEHLQMAKEIQSKLK